jgi:hypothetical protein
MLVTLVPQALLIVILNENSTRHSTVPFACASQSLASVPRTLLQRGAVSPKQICKEARAVSVYVTQVSSPAVLAALL